MKKRWILAGFIILIIGFILIGFLTGILSIPTVKSISNQWGDVTDETTEIISTVTIENTNPFRITLPRVEVEYAMIMNNIKMAEGSIKDIKLYKGDTTIQVSSYLDNTKIPEWWVSHLNHNETTVVEIQPVVVIDAEFTEPAVETQSKTISVTTDLLGNINSEAGRRIAVGPLNLTILSVSAVWGNVSADVTELFIELVIENSIGFNLSLPQMNYSITMNNISIGKGSAKTKGVLSARTNSSIMLVTQMNNTRFDDWFVSHVQNYEHTLFEIRLDSTILCQGICYFVDELVLYQYEFDTNLLG